MRNVFFDAVRAETDPMFDAAVVTASGVEAIKLPNGNDHNNCHSATKFFVAAMIGMLADEGKLSLGDKVTSFFAKDELPGNMDARWDYVTVAQTMQHKTGLEIIPFSVDDDNSYGMIRAAYGGDFLRALFSLPLQHEPGSTYRYSDMAYYLLCRVIERAGGLNAETYLRRKIANPIGWGQWGMSKTPDGTPVGGDGLYATAADMAKFAYVCALGGTYEGRTYLSAQYLAAMRENDFATTRFRDTDVWLKTGANGQGIAYSVLRPAGVAWHGYSENGGCKRNDRMFEAFVRFLDDRFGKL